MQPALTPPFFSVVIPLYNKEPHIKRTLLSVLKQSFTNFEVVVVDDGSRDGGPALVSAMEDARVRLVTQKNGGVSAARNTGIAQARGVWIAFLDADDWFHPDHLSVLADCISSDPTAQFVASGYRTIDEVKLEGFKGWELEKPLQRESIANLPDRWALSAPFFTSSVAVRRDLLNTLVPCFAIGESHGEDMDLWFRTAERSHIAYDPRPTVGRTLVADSLTTQQRKVIAPPFFSRMKLRADNGVTPPRLRQPTLDFVNQQLLTLARRACAQGDRSSGKALFANAARMTSSPRWWVTLGMVYLVPSRLIAAFQHWRTLRRMNIH